MNDFTNMIDKGCRREGEGLLLSPKPFTDFGAKEWQEYVRSLYKEPERKKAARDFSFRFNDKGTFIITVRNREPKYLTPDEIDTIATEAGLPAREVWVHVGKRKNLTVKRENV